MPATKLAELVALQRRYHGARRLRRSLGDGYLYTENPFFRRIRDAALGAGFRYTLDDPGAYFGFPLTALPTLLATRRIPYRASFDAVLALEQSRPGFFSLRDLEQNRPAPNYLLHESAHAVAFAAVFGRPRDVRGALGDRSRLVHVMLGEAYAMTAEYLAACAVQGPLHAWLFSISSYRHRTQKKKVAGELIEQIGLGAMTWALMAAFLYNNFLVDRLRPAQVERILELGPQTAALSRDAALVRRLGSCLSGLMVMSPEFRLDTSRLFLTSLGYPRDIRRVLAFGPLDAVERDEDLRAGIARLSAILSGERLRAART
jgi:hypothetical protein